MHKQLFDMSKELKLYRHENGIKLIRPDTKKFQRNLKYTGHTVNSFFRLPLCVYFADINSINLNLNEPTASFSGFSSIKDAMGKGLSEVFTKESVAILMHTDRQVIETKKPKIVENTPLRKDNLNLHVLSVKCPWYNEFNDIIGYMGCSIILGNQPLANSLTEIANLGLLSNSDQYQNYIGKEFENVYFSSRELECLRHTIRGKTAKQVAVEMKISRRTVEEHLNNIKIKMGVFSKAELIEKGFELFQ